MPGGQDFDPNSRICTTELCDDGMPKNADCSCRRDDRDNCAIMLPKYHEENTWLFKKNQELKQSLEDQHQCVMEGWHEGKRNNRSCIKKCQVGKMKPKNTLACRKCCSYAQFLRKPGNNLERPSHKDMCEFPGKALKELSEHGTDQNRQIIGHFVSVVKDETNQRKIYNAWNGLQMHTLVPLLKRASEEMGHWPQK